MDSWTKNWVVGWLLSNHPKTRPEKLRPLPPARNPAPTPVVPGAIFDHRWDGNSDGKTMGKPWENHGKYVIFFRGYMIYIRLWYKLSRYTLDINWAVQTSFKGATKTSIICLACTFIWIVQLSKVSM